jgi:putative hydrolase of the HAD superfamily
VGASHATPVDAVTLDAAGTLIDVAEPVGETYARVAGRHGIARTPADLERGFRAAFAAAPPLAFPGASPARLPDHERAWWYAVVRRAFGTPLPAAAFDACFAELFALYARPEAWRVAADARSTLTQLRADGLRLAIVSNFDARLCSIVDGLGLSALVDTVIHSTRVGAAKPDPAIFRAALAALGVSPARSAHVGDRAAEDVAGAQAAGMQAVLLDRHGTCAAGTGSVHVVRTLDALPGLVSRR